MGEKRGRGQVYPRRRGSQDFPAFNAHKQGQVAMLALGKPLGEAAPFGRQSVLGIAVVSGSHNPCAPMEPCSRLQSFLNPRLPRFSWPLSHEFSITPSPPGKDADCRSCSLSSRAHYFPLPPVRQALLPPGSAGAGTGLERTQGHLATQGIPHSLRPTACRRQWTEGNPGRERALLRSPKSLSSLRRSPRLLQGLRPRHQAAGLFGLSGIRRWRRPDRRSAL